MEASETDGKHEVRTNTSVFHLDTSNESRINQEQVVQVGKVTKCLSPLINSMRLFGLYFTRKPRIHCESEVEQPARRCADWKVEHVGGIVRGEDVRGEYVKGEMVYTRLENPSEDVRTGISRESMPQLSSLSHGSVRLGSPQSLTGRKRLARLCS